MMVKPPASEMDLGEGRGRQRGDNGRGNGSRRRHAVQVTEMSGGRLGVVGVGNVQVDGAPLRERRWGAGVTERCCDN